MALANTTKANSLFIDGLATIKLLIKKHETNIAPANGMAHSNTPSRWGFFEDELNTSYLFNTFTCVETLGSH